MVLIRLVAHPCCVLYCFSIRIGIESEGLSAGISQSFSESWSTTRTYSSAQTLNVSPGQAGNINLEKQYFVAEGRVRFVLTPSSFTVASRLVNRRSGPRADLITERPRTATT